MVNERKYFCFGTLALGKNYRDLALELSKDLEMYAPGTDFLILTDNPTDFRDRANVLTFKHRQHFFCDNDKSLLIKTALSLYDTCICIDADMRILAPIPTDLTWLPGITARSCATAIAHHQTRINQTDPPNPTLVKELAFLKKVASKINLDLEADRVAWIHEFLFAVTKDGGKEVEFIQWFERLSRYIELNGIYLGSGSAMGLAAAKVGLPVRHDIMEGISFFDDRIERVRISKGEAEPNDKLLYFEKLKMLKYPKRSLPEKVVFKLCRWLKNFERSLRLRLESLRNFDFYYRL